MNIEDYITVPKYKDTNYTLLLEWSIGNNNYNAEIQNAVIHRSPSGIGIDRIMDNGDLELVYFFSRQVPLSIKYISMSDCHEKV